MFSVPGVTEIQCEPSTFMLLKDRNKWIRGQPILLNSEPHQDGKFLIALVQSSANGCQQVEFTHEDCSKSGFECWKPYQQQQTKASDPKLLTSCKYLATKMFRAPIITVYFQRNNSGTSPTSWTVPLQLEVPLQLKKEKMSVYWKTKSHLNKNCPYFKVQTSQRNI